jgi:hypothetical protein
VGGLHLYLGLGPFAELGVSAGAGFPQPGIIACGLAGDLLGRFTLQNQEVTSLPPRLGRRPSPYRPPIELVDLVEPASRLIALADLMVCHGQKSPVERPLRARFSRRD